MILTHIMSYRIVIIRTLSVMVRCKRSTKN